MRAIHGIGELEALVSQELGVSAWHTVTQMQIDAFADATGDHSPIHVDPEFAKNGRFGATVAHGLYTLSLGPRFLHEIFSMDGVAVGLNYGFDRVRWITPVPVDSRLRMRAVLASVVPIEGGIRVEFSETFEIEGTDRPACVATAIAAYYI
jgi:acyl dehydratase